MDKYIIEEDKFDEFWEDVIKNNNPFNYMDITYYEHDYVNKQYIIKVKKNA